VPGGNPVVPLVHLVRAAVPPEVAGWVHHGATSQDVLDTALGLVASDVLRQAESDLEKLADCLASLSEATRTVPLVGRTLTQQALPTTLGLRVAGWLDGVLDSIERLRACLPLPVSLGGPVGSLSTYGGDAAAVLSGFAAALGLSVPPASWHTRRTPLLDVAHSLTVTGATCGTIASDVLVMAQTEIGEASEGTGGPSSSMPHKANPTQSVLVTAAARQLPALGSVLAASAVSEQDRPPGAWHAEWQPLRDMLRLAGAAAERTATLVPGLVLDHDAMARNLSQLVGALGRDDLWVTEQTAGAGLWVDRVLARCDEVLG
jgi:3-carboxy-cis,cis-muconate cycloisomerase